MFFIFLGLLDFSLRNVSSENAKITNFKETLGKVFAPLLVFGLDIP